MISVGWLWFATTVVGTIGGAIVGYIFGVVCAYNKQYEAELRKSDEDRLKNQICLDVYHMVMNKINDNTKCKQQQKKRRG